MINKIDFYAPVRDPHTGELLGYLVDTVNTSFLKSYLDSITLGETGFCFLLDTKGYYIYHPDSEPVGTMIGSDKLSRVLSDYTDGKMEVNGSFTYYFEDTNLPGYCIDRRLNWVYLYARIWQR